MTKSMALLPVLLLLFILPSTARDTITPTQPLPDGQILVSSNSAFKLGFFSPNNSTTSRYIGIWYNTIPIQQVVWVANRDTPVTTTTGILHLNSTGILSLQDNTNHLLWSAPAALPTAKDPILRLLDTGNLILTDGSRFLWQSFDYPTDTLLPGMKIGRDFKTNHKWRITSWKTASDPSPGSYSYEMDTDGVPEMRLVQGTVTLWRTGPWSSSSWSGIPTMPASDTLSFVYADNQDEVYYEYGLRNMSMVSPMSVDHNGVLQRLVWDNGGWFSYWKFPMEPCDTYNVCGSYGVCQSSPVTGCSCLQGFEPRSPELWKLRYWSAGCGRRTALNCTGGDGFLKVSVLKLPDASNASKIGGLGVDECRARCLMKCSCVAFAVVGGGGNGCITWVGELKDMKVFAAGGDDLYLKLAASDLADGDTTNGRKKLVKVISIVTAVAAAVLLICGSLFILRKKFKKDEDVDYELPLFSFYTIATSTNKFSHENKIGEGGFGPVYKGMLKNGQEIAVKRLSRDSGQGIEEFKNEIKLIAKVQHKNLVRLLGCCIKGEERMLVYEYMPNRSLDCFIFDHAQSMKFDWQGRIRVIEGIAQGLLYLHKYSRFKIIHRDLKLSNILLDADMNPKISDFGIARIFGSNREQENTKRVVGTYGYMPPEYAIRGFFSDKSDVFSFGVLLLEIVTGKRNGSTRNVGEPWFLIVHVWQLWEDNRTTDLLDPVLRSSCPLHELTRYIHVGLLCVQEDAADRPSMLSVVSFLNSDHTAELPSPKRVAFSAVSDRMDLDRHPSIQDSACSFEYAITQEEPR